jgi:maleylacetate reductase
VIVRWGLQALPDVLEELAIARPLLISTQRWEALQLPVERRFHGVLAHAELRGVRAATDAVGDADGLVALGGGSALDTAKAVSSRTRIPIVSIPTTYSGAEWTEGFGVRDAESRTKSGGGGARTVAIVYDPSLTLGLPARESAGSAMNALAHCVEALYARERSEETDAQALAGARLISTWLPVVVQRGCDLEARRALLEGAMHAGAALRAGMGLGHAMAQALGGRYGLAHGTMNAVCLPAALRYNREVAAQQIARLGAELGDGDPLARVAGLSGLAGPARLREYDVPRDELGAVAAAVAERPAAKANPRPAPAPAILALLEQTW